MKPFYYISLLLSFLGSAFNAVAQQARKASLKFIEHIEVNMQPDDAPKQIHMPAATTDSITSVNFSADGIECMGPLQFKYAQLLDREVESIDNTALFQFIDKWWKTRYRFGGTTAAGIDCSSFTGHLIESVYNIAIPRTSQEQYQVSEKIGREQLLEGDLVFFTRGRHIGHVGVYLGNGYFVHSSTSSGVTIDNLDTDPYYQRRFSGGGRVTNTTASRKAANSTLTEAL